MLFDYDDKQWKIDYHVRNAATHDYDIWITNVDDEQDVVESFELPMDVQVELQDIVDNDVWEFDVNEDNGDNNDDDFYSDNESIYDYGD